MLILGASTALWLQTTPASAHVKWFVPSGAAPSYDRSLVFSSRTASVVLASAVAVSLLYMLQRLVGNSNWPDLEVFRRMAVGAPALLAVQAAVSLVYAAVQPALFVPNIPLQSNLGGFTIAGVELGVAFSLITGIGEVVAALVLASLVAVAFVIRPVDAFDQVSWVGIAVVLLVVGRTVAEVRRPRPWFQRRGPAWSARAVAILRVCTGVSIVAPALTEKVWNPAAGTAFLREYSHFNVLRSLGVSDETFVLLAGVVEVIIGVLLATGLLTRVVVLGMWLPFNIGIAFLPPQELIGHIPILGIMYLLLVHSSGDTSTEEAPEHGAPAEDDEPSASEPAGAQMASGSTVT